MGCLFSCCRPSDGERLQSLSVPLLPVREGGEQEASAVEAFNALMAGVLPSVRLSIARKLLELHKKGGVRLPAGYAFNVRRRSAPSAEIGPSEVIDTLRVELLSVRVAQKKRRVVVARARPSAQRASSAEMKAATSIQHLYRQNLARRRWTSATAAMVGRPLHLGVHHVRLEVDALILLEFFHDTVDFRLGPRSSRACAPSATLELKTVRMRARLLLVWDLPRSSLQVSFLETPDVRFNLEIALGCVELPNLIENQLLPWAVARQLAARDINHPIEIDLGLQD